MTEFQNKVRMAPAQTAAIDAGGAPAPAPVAAIARRPAQHLWLLAMLGAVAAWMMMRNTGLNPVIFADEWYYSKMSRLVTLSESILPSYLYLWLFSASSACGDAFLDCARAANVLLYVGAGPFIYAIARQVTGRFMAWLVVLLSLMAPANSYTAYFMPESTYYFGFAVLSWIALTRVHWGWALRAVATGVVVGLMSLVKVHALFLLPALCLFLVYSAWSAQPRTGWILKGLASAVIAAGTTVALKFGLGYLLAGENGLSLFGTFYAGAANANSGRSLLTFLPPAFINGRGHLMAMAMLAALPLAILAHHIVSARARAEAGPQRSALHVYALLMLGAAAGLTIAYTASIAGQGPQEVVRLHLRYYSFVMPLLFIVGAAPIGKPAAAARTRFLWPIAIALIAVLLVALVKLPAYWLNEIDGPEIAALNPGGWRGRVVLALNVVVLVLWALRSKLAAPLFVFLALPLMMAAATRVTGNFLGHHVRDLPADQVGKYVHQTVPAADRKFLTVAGNDIALNMRAMFHIDDPDTVMRHLEKDAPIEIYQIPMQGKWLLVMGQHALPAGLAPEVTIAGSQLVRLRPVTERVGTALLSQPLGGGIIASVEGLSLPEGLGRWSNAKQVVLNLREPLPPRAVIIMRAHAFADNANLPFKLRIGEQVQEFRIGAESREFGLPVVTDGTQRQVIIEVPHPVSPADIGMSPDGRKLGIALTEFAIGLAPAH